MARTRSTKAAPKESKDSTESKSSTSKFTLAPQSENPSHVFIFPSKATPDSRIVTLPHPRHSRPSRYLVCPETGIYEFIKVAAPKTTPRSWLIEASPVTPEANTAADANATISTSQDLYLATTIDPLFLSLPALAGAKKSKGSDESKRMFLTSDDYFDKLPEESSHLSEILQWPKTRALLERRMGAICDTVDAGDETMFRLNEDKLVSVIIEKAKKMSENILPPSMEEKFVKKALEAPVLVQKREMKGGEVVVTTSNHDSDPQPDAIETQSTTASTETTATSESQPSTVATSFTEDPTPAECVKSAMEASSEVVKLQRLRVAFNFICSSCIEPTLANQLEKSLASASSLDFSPLDEYIKKLTKLRSETLAARSMGDYSRKHGRDEEEDEARAEKKRKMEEEKKKKASESRGVRELKKVNTKGMKKMSDFFKKK